MTYMPITSALVETSHGTGQFDSLVSHAVRALDDAGIPWEEVSLKLVQRNPSSRSACTFSAHMVQPFAFFLEPLSRASISEILALSKARTLASPSRTSLNNLALSPV